MSSLNKVLVTQSCLTSCTIAMDHSPPGSSVCGILQARILEWVTISFSRGSSLSPGIKSESPALQADSLLSEPPRKPKDLYIFLLYIFKIPAFRVTWDAVSWAWSPKNSCWIKHNSQLLGCEYFLSWQKQVLSRWNFQVPLEVSFEEPAIRCLTTEWLPLSYSLCTMGVIASQTES